VARRALAGILVVLACLLAPVAAVAVWARSAVVETDGWVELVEPLPQDPEVGAAVAEELTDIVLDGLGVAGPARVGAEPLVRRGAERLVRSDAFGELWVGAHRQAHERLILALRQEGSPVQEVRVQLLTAVAVLIDGLRQPLSRVIDTRGIPELPAEPTLDQATAVIEAAFGRQLAAGRGEVEIVPADRVDDARVAFRAVDRSAIPLVGGWLVLAAIAIVAARERFRVGAFLGFGTSAMLLFGWVVALGLAPVLASYVGGSGLARQVAEAAADSAVSSFASFVVPVAIAAAVAGLVSAVAGAIVRRRTGTG